MGWNEKEEKEVNWTYFIKSIYQSIIVIFLSIILKNVFIIQYPY